jgi:predicted TIM-barrel fold metal-dependent hydrolase
MNNSYFDAHCHIFSLRFALKEAKNILFDMLIGRYPWDSPDVGDVKRLAMHDRSGIIELLIQFYEMISASLGTEEKNLDLLQGEASKAMPGVKWHVVPLMMDIYYILAYPLYKDKKVAKAKRAVPKEISETDLRKEFQKAWDEILHDLETHIKSKARDVKLPEKKTLDISLDIINEERDVEKTMKFKAGLARAKGLFHAEGQTDGYCYHLKNLEELVKKRKGELYPFIAVDPRRPGMIDEIVGGKYIGNDGPFYGVKLYPRLGYHPEAEPMDALYDYCNGQKIPITFHCGKSGFPPGTGWKYAEFGNPENFKPIVEKYPDLRINFAHLGSSAPKWAKYIVTDLMTNHDNVYSDLACYTDDDDLNFVKGLWSSNPILKSRLMFGTDFDVMYFTDIVVTLEEYFENFKSTFSADDLKLMMHDNPMRFFGL